jgi:hypothetical protein
MRRPGQVRLAVLGCDDDVYEVCRAAHESELADVVAAFEWENVATEKQDQLHKWFPHASFEKEWESLLGRDDIDAVVISGCNPAADGESPLRTRRAEQLKKLAIERVPTLVSHPACEPIIALEVEMVRADVRALVVPMVARAFHPAVNRLLDFVHAAERAVDQGKGDGVEQITVVRRLPDRNRESVLHWLTQDLELIKRLIGPIVKLSAVGPSLPTGEDVMNRPKRTPALSQLVVHVQGISGRVARWSVDPGSTIEAEIVVSTANESLRLFAPDREAWRLTSPQPSSAEGDQSEFPASDWGTEHLRTLARVLDAPHESPLWLEAARTLDAVGSVDSALGRGRAIEFFNEEPSEQSSFKAVMSVWGCLLIVGTTILFFLLAMGIRMFAPRNEEGKVEPIAWGWAQICLVAPFVAFLALQVLLWGISKRTAAAAANTPTRPDDLQPDDLETDAAE